MPFQEFWGATDTVGVALPTTPIGFLLILLYAVLFLIVLYRERHNMRRLSSRRWLLAVLLSIMAFLLSQLFPIRLPTDIAWWPMVTALGTPINLLAAFPVVLAAASLSPGAAMLVGLCSGLGRALGQTHQLYDLFYFAFAAWITARLLQQTYRGRPYIWLRSPVLAGVLGQLSVVPMIWLTALLTAIPTGFAAMDVSLVTAEMHWLALLLEGFVGGLVADLMLRAMPQLRPPVRLTPAPARRSVRRYMLNHFLSFAAAIVFLNGLVMFVVLVPSATQALVTQMAYGSNAAAAQVTALQATLENSLLRFSGSETLARDGRGVDGSALGAIYRAAATYEQILLVDDGLHVTSEFPAASADGVTLTDAEQTAVTRAIESGQTSLATKPGFAAPASVTVVVPVGGTDGGARTALLGRVPPASVANTLQPAQTPPLGASYIVEGTSQLIARLGDALPLPAWSALGEPAVQPLPLAAEQPGDAFLVRDQETLVRSLVYVSPVQMQNWSVVTAVPYAAVLRQALFDGLPMILLLVGVTFVFYVRLASFGRDITEPIEQLADASRSMASGGSFAPAVTTDREDEIGELSRSFTQMQRALKQRLDDLSLLLGVSQDVTASLNVNQSIPVVLQGALRGTGAIGARAVVLSPTGGYPLTFGEGPAAARMQRLDRAVMMAIRHKGELSLATPEDLQNVLELDAVRLPVQALLAVPLISQQGAQGALYLGYAQPHASEQAERNLVRTLAGQAAVLVENAHLFANAESGRRRLAAVLASTTDAVIVTDQTERVLLLNRALETALQVRAGDVKGRPVADVLDSEQLAKALTGSDTDTRDLEIRGRDGRIYYANVSTIFSHANEVYGRVGVLHDVTHLKEVDKMKSEFVSSVSHDLRTPLTVMHGYATILAMMEDLNEEQSGYVDKILQQIDQMASLVNNLLDLGRIEAGIDMELERVDVTELLQEVATEHWQHAHLSGVRVELDVAEDLPSIQADPALMRQAVANLLMNGFKYAPNSGIIRLGAVCQNGLVVISVVDSGPGIAKQDQMHLFEKFYRVKQHSGQRVKGSGLGLAIVKSIAERHGGQAWCKSQLGVGSTFYLSVPAAADC